MMGYFAEGIKSIVANSNDREPGFWDEHCDRVFLGLRALWYAFEAENVGKSGEIPGLCRNCNVEI